VKPTIEQALAAHKVGKLSEADALYRAILKDQPQHPDANHNLGVLAVSANKPAEGLKLLKAALEGNPQQGQYWISYIDALIKNQQLETARIVLEQGKARGLAGEQVEALSKQLGPQSGEPYSAKTQRQTFTQQRKKFSAKKEKKKSASTSPKRPLEVQSPSDAQIKVLHSLYLSGKYAEAEKLAVAMTKEYAGYQSAWKMLAVLFRTSGRLHSAEAANQKAIALEPNDAEAHSNLGAVLNELGRREEAEASYRKAIVLNPGLANVHYNLGITLQELGRLEEAEASCRQAIAIKPGYAEAHSNLGVTLRDLGRLEEAQASYRQAISLKPDYAEANSNLGGILRDLGQFEEAEASCRQAITINPDYAEAHSNLATVLGRVGRFEEAVTGYRQATALKPDFAAAHTNLGKVLQELGRFEEAVASYTQAVALEQDNREARYHLGVLLYGFREFKRAAEQLIDLNVQDSRAYLLLCLYKQGELVIFNEQLEHAIDLGENNSLIGSLCLRSALNYGTHIRNPYCGAPFNYVKKTDLAKKYDFEIDFRQAIQHILSNELLSSRVQGLLVNGEQTAGDLFMLDSQPIKKIESIIRAEIAEYRTNFDGSDEGLIQKWPSSYDLKGWLVQMKNGGALRPHIHEKGWISGSIYINVPSKKEADSGNLVLCIDEGPVDSTLNPGEGVDVLTGNLVLFPSSLMHYTIPFDSEEARIVLAFDVHRK